MKFIVAAVFLVVCMIGAKAVKRYDGYQLLQLLATSTDQLTLIMTFVQNLQLDIWSEGPGYVDVFVPPHKLSAFGLLLAENGIKFEVKSDRIQKDIEEEAKRLAFGKQVSGKTFNYSDYNTYSDIMAELDNLVSRCPSRITCYTFSIGASYEGRAIKGIRISKCGQGRKCGRGRQSIWLDATIHSKEWLATATHLNIIKHLIDNYMTDSEVQWLIDTYDFYLLPVLNPDGYEYSWANDRTWSKNRSPNAGSTCFGTDLNKNFEEMWGNAGTSTNPCDEKYGGSGPASEVETRHIQAALSAIGSTIHRSFHIHTFGQYWLIPWGSVVANGSCNITSDHKEMMVVANAGADAIEKTFNTVWKRGNACVVLYPSSGSVMDYAKARAGIKYAAATHLRGNSSIVPPDLIVPAFQEYWNGMVAAINTSP